MNKQSRITGLLERIGLTPKRSILGYKLMVRIVCFSAVLAIFSTGIQLVIEYRWDIKTIHSTLNNIQINRLESIANSIWDININQIRIDLQQILLLHDIVRVQLKTNLAKNYEYGREPSESLTISRKYSLNSKQSPVQLGTLTVFASLEGVYSRLAGKMIVILVTNLFKTFFVSLFILFIVSRVVTQRLGNLVVLARNLDDKDISSGCYFTRYVSNKPDELDEVAQALSDMCTKVDERTLSLRESEEKFRAMVENLPLAIYFSVGSEFKCNYVNPTFSRLFGYSMEDVPTAAQWWPLAYPDDTVRQHIVDTWMSNVQRAMATQSHIESMETVVTCKDGSEKYILWGGIALGDKNYFFGLDLTDRKRAEEDKEKLQAQLNQAQKMESVGRLAGGVAHDFNNMLGVILGHAEVALMNTDLSSQLTASLKEIQNAAKHSSDLTRQLLAFARRQTIAPKVIDLNSIVSEILGMLKRLIGEDIHLSWQPAKDLWSINVDPSQINQILINLCVNARDAIADVGKITLETENRVFDVDYCSVHTGFVQGEYVQLTVSDDGPGMDKETLGQIFEPFFTTKGRDSGTGLGLAMVYGIVKQNNGFIHVYSEPGQGSIFKIFLPRYSGNTSRSLTNNDSGSALCGQETILLVEDEPSILNITMMMLEMKGYTVLPAISASEAIRLANTHMTKIDLLITDVVMPEVNGRDLAKQLVGIHPHLKFMFMSGYTANVIAHHGVLDDGVCFIQKPFSINDLAAKVRAILDC